MGRKFTIWTDHKPLVYLDSTEFKNNKIANWQNMLARFNFIVQHIQGQNNQFADLLSRPFGVKPPKRTSSKAPDIARGKFYKFGNFDIYVPSWVDIDSHKPMEIKQEEFPNVLLTMIRPQEKSCSEIEDLKKAQKDDELLQIIIESIANGKTRLRKNENMMGI